MSEKFRTILNADMEAALNKQVNAELWSAYLYLSMSFDMNHKGFGGIGQWFFVQAQEEFGHAKKIMDFILSRDGKVALKPIEEVRQVWNSPRDAFEDTLMHEKVVTEMIHNLMDKAVDLKDYSTQQFLAWFVTEQVEEEDTARKYLSDLEMIKENPAALYSFDKDLGARTSTTE